MAWPGARAESDPDTLFPPHRASQRVSDGDEEDRIEDLERRLDRIEERLARIEAAASEDESPAETAEDADVEEPASTPAPEASDAEPTAFTPAQRSEPAPTAASSGPEGRAREPVSLEDRLGADWLAKAGMVTLVLGVAFFLRYAFENDWIGLTGRVVLGVVGGLALWGAGEALHRREGYGVYPQVLAGGGAAIVYFSVFAAYAFDDLRQATGMTLELDAILLGLTALGLAGYAVARRMPTLAGLAALLGAATGIVAEQWEGFSVFYTVLLSGAVTAAALWRRWASVALVALVAGYATLGIELSLDVDPTLVATGTLVLLGLFTAAAWRVRTERLEPAALGLVATGSLFAVLSGTIGPYETFAVVYLVLVALAVVPLALVRGTRLALTAALAATFGALAIGLAAELPPGEVRWGALALLVIFGAAAPAAARRDPPGEGDVPLPTLLAGGSLLAAWGLVAWSIELEGLAWQGPTAGGVALLGLLLALVPAAGDKARQGWAVAGLVAALAWPPIQFDGVATALAWATLTLAAAGIARVREGSTARLAAGLGALVTALHLTVFEAPELHEGELGGMVALVAFVAGTLGAMLAWRAEATGQGEEAGTAWGLLAVTLAVPIVYLGAALDGTWIPISWALAALTVVVLGFTVPMRTLRLAAFGLFGLVLGRVFLYDLAVLDVVYRIVTFIVVGAILLAASFLYARQRGRDEATTR